MTSNSQVPQPIDISEHDDTEAKVRRALGLGSVAAGQGHSTHAARSGERFASDRPKSRFVQDGEVPVVMIRRDNGQHSADPSLVMGRSTAIRLQAAEKALKSEQHAREIAERSLSEAQAAIRDLQTKLGHAVLVRDEARANVQRIEIEKLALERMLAAQRDAQQTPKQLPLAITDTPRPRAVAKTKSTLGTPSPTADTTGPAANTNPRGRRVSSQPKPVKWWVKSK